MKILRHPADAVNSVPSVVALGNFDGFHRGHQAVVGEAGRLAKALGFALTVVVTEPHPVSFFKPDIDSFRLTPFRERAHLMEKFGVDQLLVLPFDKNLASMSAQDFVRDLLCEGLKAQHIVVGYDYRFGKGRGGGTDVLAWMGQEEGFGLSVIKPISTGVEGFAGDVYSSTLVRKKLKAGEVRAAAALLGHWWAVTGKVQAGDQRGRTIGFPTANVALDDVIEPKFGVYAVRLAFEGGGETGTVNGVANLGRRPTFDKEDVLLEVHLFDFYANIYDRHVRVEFVSFIRAEQKFDGFESLMAQIAKDSDIARIALADPENARDRLARPTLDQYLDLRRHWP